jgi:hypothetical protein
LFSLIHQDWHEVPYHQCTLEYLRASRPRLPLSYHQFLIAMHLTFEALGSREKFEGRRGVGGLDTVTGKILT